MRYPIAIIKRARTLRSRGKTYSEIMVELKIKTPKSTMSAWCQGVSLPKWYKDKIEELNYKNFTKAQQMAWASNRIKRERFLRALILNNNHLIKKVYDKDILKIILSILHLGEGSKWKSHSGLLLGSSDPDIIKLYIRLLFLCYGIKSNQLKCRISYRADQDIQKLQKYWSRMSTIPLRNFYKTIPDPRTVGKPTKRKDYMGVCVVSCGGSHIQLELEAIPKLILAGL